MDLIKELESQQLKKEMPVINVGDTVRVHVKIKEGDRKSTRLNSSHSGESRMPSSA